MMTSFACFCTLKANTQRKGGLLPVGYLGPEPGKLLKPGSWNCNRTATTPTNTANCFTQLHNLHYIWILHFKNIYDVSIFTYITAPYSVTPSIFNIFLSPFNCIYLILFFVLYLGGLTIIISIQSLKSISLHVILCMIVYVTNHT